MATTGVTYKKKFNINKNVTVSTIFSDVSMAQADSIYVQGGSAQTGDERCSLINFTIPPRPEFGEGELESLQINYFIRDINAFPTTSTVLSGLSAYRVLKEDITEGGNTIIGRPTVISTNDANNSFIRDVFDGTMAVDQLSKAYTFQTESNQIFQSTSGYVTEDIWNQNVDPETNFGFNVSNHKSYVELSDLPSAGGGGGKQRIVRLVWDRAKETLKTVKKGKAVWPFKGRKVTIRGAPPFPKYSYEDECYTNLLPYLKFPDKTTLGDMTTVEDFASSHSTIFDDIQIEGEVTTTITRDGDTSNYMVTKPSFSNENVTGGGRSLKLHTRWEYGEHTRITDAHHVSTGETVFKPKFHEMFNGSDHREFKLATGATDEPVQLLYTDNGRKGGNLSGLGQGSIDRQEIKLSKRIISTPTNITSYRVAAQGGRPNRMSKDDTTFIDFSLFIDKMAPAYRSNKSTANSGKSRHNCPRNVTTFPRGQESSRAAASGGHISANAGMTTARRGVFITFGDRKAESGESLYDYVQDHCLWVVRVSSVAVAHTSGAGAGNAVHQFACAYGGQYLEGDSAGTQSNLDYGHGINNRTHFDDLSGDIYKDNAFNGHTIMFVNAKEKGNVAKMRHIIDYDAGTGTITLDESLGANVTVNDLALIWTDNVNGAGHSDGGEVVNPNLMGIARKNFSMIGLARTTLGATEGAAPSITLFQDWTSSSQPPSVSTGGGKFSLYPPTSDVHMGWFRPTGGNTISSGGMIENFPKNEHLNFTFRFLNDTEASTSRSPANGPQHIIEYTITNKSIREDRIYNPTGGQQSPRDFGGTRAMYNWNLASYGKYPGTAREYDDGTLTDDWVTTHTPQTYTPDYMTIWVTNHPNMDRMDGMAASQSQLRAVRSVNPWEWYVDNNADDQEYEMVSDTDAMETIVYINGFGIGNVQPLQRNNTFLDRNIATLPDSGRAPLNIKGNTVNSFSSTGNDDEHLANSFICLGFDNQSDMITSAVDPDTATDQKYLLWSGLNTANEANLYNNSGLQWGITPKSDQLAMSYSNGIERLGDWDGAYSFTEGAYSLAAPNRGLGQGIAATDALDDSSFAYAVDGFKQKGWWKMKWHPRLNGILSQTINDEESSISNAFTTTNLGSNFGVDDYFNGWEIYWKTGANAGTTSAVTDYVAAPAGQNTGRVYTDATGFATSDTYDLYPKWEKREVPWASTKIVEVLDSKSFKVADVEVLEGFKDDTYIIYRMGTGVGGTLTGRGARFDGNESKKYYKSGLKIGNTPTLANDQYYVINLTTKALDAEDGSTDLLVDANLQELWICPEKYWLTLALQNNTYISSTLEPGQDIKFDSVCVTEAPSVGTTWNEFLFTDAQSNPNSWSLAAEGGTSLVTNQDYGYGALETDAEFVPFTKTGGKGILGANTTVEKSTYNIMDLKGLVSVDSLEDGDKATITLVPLQSENSHLFTIDSRTYSSGNPPYMTAIYRDQLPEVSDFAVIPNKDNAFHPELSWSSSGNDIWYGFLIISDENIYNQYKDAIVHFPLNDIGNHEEVATTPTENISNSTSNVLISGPLYDLEGLAGNCLRFDGTNDYLKYGTTTDGNFQLAATSDATSDATTELSVIAHIVPNSGVSDDRYIISQEDTGGRKFSIKLNSSQQIVARVYDGDSSYVELIGSSVLVTNGEMPTSVILTVDTTLSSGNVKLFINGKLEDVTGVALATGTTNNWQTGATMQSANSYLIIGNSSHTEETLDSSFEGKIEEVVVYKKCIYPVTPRDNKFLFTKPTSELVSGESLAQSKSYTSRLFIKDYHNIRGSTVNKVATSPQVSWRKAAFALDTT